MSNSSNSNEQNSNEQNSNKRKKVLCPMERKGKTYWMRVGSAFINKDGSTNVYLDAFPANGKLQIRDWDDRDNTHQKNIPANY